MSSTNFDICFRTIQENETLWRAGGTDIYGHHITDVSDLVGMTYQMCIAQCGTTPVAFDFAAFSTQFSSFMLPFLALTAQLPFGAISRADNFSTIAMTIGSPTLAIFSLMITVLNSRWLKRRFGRISYPNANQAATILNNLQESLLRVEEGPEGCPLLASLVVLPQNDQWWHRGANALSFTHTWTMSNIATVMWAIVAYILTVSSMDPMAAGTWHIVAPAIACAWLWLLPLVVGWMQISPNCDEEKLKKELAVLNEAVFIAVGDSGSTASPVLARECTDRFPIEVWPPRRGNAHKADSDVSDESRSPPFYNYARIFSWARAAEKVASAFESASFHASRRQPVAGSTWRSANEYGPSIHSDNRVGNAADVRGYIQFNGEEASRWAPQVWRRIIYSAAAALIFQWLTTGSAVVAAWMTPTVGLGCHSGSFIIHGALSTFSFLIILLGEILQQFYHPTTSHLSLQEMIAYFAVVCRRVGKIFAWFNAFMFISVDVLTFANVLGNCFCASSVLGLGYDRAYNTLFYTTSMHLLNWWSAAVTVATVSAAVFWFSIFILKR
ncbi:hypothetical protein C8J57DRAFT_1407321 [Mycena rebaudengoi]|nr:hypothetical protein C8J57DRAFT_1407321 [Mycena rebaudengoi]